MALILYHQNISVICRCTKTILYYWWHDAFGGGIQQKNDTKWSQSNATVMHQNVSVIYRRIKQFCTTDLPCYLNTQNRQETRQHASQCLCGRGIGRGFSWWFDTPILSNYMPLTCIKMFLNFRDVPNSFALLTCRVIWTPRTVNRQGSSMHPNAFVEEVLVAVASKPRDLDTCHRSFWHCNEKME